LFCLQYFGSGKTTLGMVFGQQIKKPDVIAHFEEQISREPDLRQQQQIADEWQLLRTKCEEKDMGYIYVPMMENVPFHVRTARALGIDIGAPPDPELLVNAVLRQAQQHPHLLHVDEILQEHLGGLRAFSVELWRKLVWLKLESKQLPRVYLFVTGRSIDMFDLPVAGSVPSPCGSTFIVLDMLHTEHITQVRRHLTDPAMHEHPILLRNFDEVTFGQVLDEALTEATGGAPRLLLYAFRALHFLNADLSTEASIKTAVYEEVYKLLASLRAVASELVSPSENSESFGLLYTFSIMKKELQLSDMVTYFSSKSAKSIGRLLRTDTFFLVRGVHSERFYLRLPHYHIVAARARWGSENGVASFLAALFGGKRPILEPWLLFENLPLHIISFRARNGSGNVNRSWQFVIPELFGSSLYATYALFEFSDSNKYQVLEGSARLIEQLEADPTRFFDSGILYPPPKSHSADAFHVVRSMKSDIPCVIFEWQMKLWNSDITMATVRDEVQKVVGRSHSVLLLLFARLGVSLKTAVLDSHGAVLVLRSWNNDKAAEYAFHGNKLLWRAESQNAKGNWHVFPEQTVSAVSWFRRESPDRNAAPVIVRPMLEVVIPHPDIIKALITPQLFDALLHYEKQRGLLQQSLPELMHLVHGALTPNPAMRVPSSVAELQHFVADLSIG